MKTGKITQPNLLFDETNLYHFPKIFLLFYSRIKIMMTIKKKKEPIVDSLGCPKM